MKEKIPERIKLSDQHTEHSQVLENVPDLGYEKEITGATSPESEQSSNSSSSSITTDGPTAQIREIDPELKGIETILASGLDPFFKGLSPAEQYRFKNEGETVAIKIQQLVHNQKAKIKDIVKLIIGWLKGLPGINKFFLEQEAKIKADAIIRRYRS